MIHHLRGRLIEKTPTYAVVECGGVGYQVHISLNTFEQLGNEESVMLHTHMVVREDAQLLYGFSQPEERSMFLLLLGVSGVGASTARMILSAMNVDQAAQAIQSGDVNAMKSVKGIGAKTAQRVVIDLRDKVLGLVEDSDFSAPVSNTNRDEALSALEVLGYQTKACIKVLDGLLAVDPEMNVERLIRNALNKL